MHVRRCLRLPGLAKEPIARDSWRCALASLRRRFRPPLMECGLVETASLHGAAPS
jgi:hypothetical protein